ncbi:hypothetical protein [Streptomyces griseoluteus]
MARLVDNLQTMPLWWLYLGLVAAGAAGGGLIAAADLAIRAAHRTQPRKEMP